MSIVTSNLFVPNITLNLRRQCDARLAKNGKEDKALHLRSSRSGGQRIQFQGLQGAQLAHPGNHRHQGARTQQDTIRSRKISTQ